jgi:hypothetical protein
VLLVRAAITWGEDVRVLGLWRCGPTRRQAGYGYQDLLFRVKTQLIDLLIRVRIYKRDLLISA